MDSAESKVKLCVQQTNGTVIEHEVSSRAVSIGALKQALSERTGIPEDRIRLMLESTILQDERTIEQYGIDGNSVLKLVQLARGNTDHPRNVSGIANANAPSPPSPTQSMAHQAQQLFMTNPQLAQTIMMANPQMREAMENNPELRQMMNDPEIMRQSLDAAQNPRLMQEVQRNNDRVLSNLDAAPGGFAHIRRMYHNIQEPLVRASDNGMQLTLDQLNGSRARALGVKKPDNSKINTTPLPNPWAKKPARTGARGRTDTRNPLAMTDQVSRNADRLARLNISARQQPSASASTSASQRTQPPGAGLLSFSRLQESLGMPPGLAATMQGHAEGSNAPVSPRGMSAISIVNPAYERGGDTGNNGRRAWLARDVSSDDRRVFEERYHSELEQLEEMGFADNDRNLRALIQSEGDLDAALTLIDEASEH
ncbi:hypothetical protein GGF46_000423 [Coemansia sp. RSA 552]|nr:hypothetical protein GGF46_000423 [Coemansia sp. RSA 552]